MKAITADTPRREIQIGGVILKAPTPYSEGDVLNANEAAAINQTYLENVGNNFRSKVLLAKRKSIAGADASPEALKAVTDEQIKAWDASFEKGEVSLDMDALQSDLDEVIANYQMGVRRSSSVEVVDPVTKAARVIAKEKLKTALQKRGTKLNTVAADWYTREIDKLLDKEHPKMVGDRNVTEEIWAAAQKQVDALKEAAADGLDELDMDGIEKPAKEEAPAEEDPNPATFGTVTE